MQRPGPCGSSLLSTPTTIDAAFAGEVAGPSRATTVRVHDSLEPAEAAWRRVEADGVLTPYQRFDWIAALLDSGLERADRLAIAVVEAGGAPVAILPLKIERRLGYSEAHLIGTDISNGDWFAMLPEFATGLTPTRLGDLLAEIARQAGGVDLIRFFNQPARWGGLDNPLLGLPHTPAPNNIYVASLGGAGLPYIEHRLSAKRRTNIRRGMRRLEESFGRLRLQRADNPAELDRQHAAFLKQRGERFAEMGIENTFAEPAFVRFFTSLAANGFDAARPALVFHALYAGDEIVATSCGAFAGDHYAQYINSTASGPAAKYSLMGVLLALLLDELVVAGITGIDMGAGDFDYKQDWTAPEPLFHGAVALTARGRLILPALDAGSALKRAIKQNPRLWAAAQQVRRRLYRVRHPRG